MDNSQPHSPHEFEAIVRKKGESFYLHIPKWNLLAKGTDLQQTYEKLYEQVDVLDARFREAGLELKQEPISCISPRASLRSAIEQFLTSIAGILGAGLIIGLFLFLAINHVGQRLTSTQNVIQEYLQTMTSPAELGKTVIDGIVNSANTIKLLTPERKTELRNSVRIIVQEIRPFTEELRPLFSSSGPESTEEFPPVGTTMKITTESP